MHIMKQNKSRNGTDDLAPWQHGTMHASLCQLEAKQSSNDDLLEHCVKLDRMPNDMYRPPLYHTEPNADAYYCHIVPKGHV